MPDFYIGKKKKERKEQIQFLHPWKQKTSTEVTDSWHFESHARDLHQKTQVLHTQQRDFRYFQFVSVPCSPDKGIIQPGSPELP